MNLLLAVCMYVAVRRTYPRDSGKDRPHLVREADLYYRYYGTETEPMEPVDRSVWLATLDNLVSIGDVIRTPHGYLPAPGSSARYKTVIARLSSIGQMVIYMQDT